MRWYINKAPSLYNHFKSKDEIVKAMYSFLREKAQQNRASGFADQGDLLAKGRLAGSRGQQ